MLSQFGGLFYKAILAFFEKIIIGSLPKSPRIAGRQFPAKSRTPEHRHDLHAQLCAEIQQREQIIFSPALDLFWRFFGNFGWKEGANGRAAGPGCRMHPERTMTRNAIEFHFGLFKRSLDFFGTFEEVATLHHIIGWLGALRP